MDTRLRLFEVHVTSCFDWGIILEKKSNMMWGKMFCSVSGDLYNFWPTVKCWLLSRPKIPLRKKRGKSRTGQSGHTNISKDAAKPLLSIWVVLRLRPGNDSTTTITKNFKNYNDPQVATANLGETDEKLRVNCYRKLKYYFINTEGNDNFRS